MIIKYKTVIVEDSQCLDEHIFYNSYDKWDITLNLENCGGIDDEIYVDLEKLKAYAIKLYNDRYVEELEIEEVGSYNFDNSIFFIQLDSSAQIFYPLIKHEEIINNVDFNFEVISSSEYIIKRLLE